MDRRLGYQVPRMWYPHARPETNSRQLSQPPPRADPLERAQRPHTSDLVRDEYYTQSAYASYTALGEDDERHPLGEALLESDEEGGGAAGSPSSATSQRRRRRRGRGARCTRATPSATSIS